MELKDLSTNWKKLQQSLDQDTSKLSKRTAVQNPLRQYRYRVKHQDRVTKIKASASGTQAKTLKSQDMDIVISTAKKISSSVSLALWAKENDISPHDLAAAYGPASEKTSSSESVHASERINEGLSSAVDAGKYISIDCEMVGVGPTPDNESALARISLVNYHGHQLYDSFVLPKEPVTDYRTHVSGITSQLLKSARTLEDVQKDVAQLLNGRVLIGHAVRHDLDALLLGHPKRDIRDTSRYSAFRQLAGGRTPSLKKLAREVLGIDIQNGEHSSVEDARATMMLFKKEKEGFEQEHARTWGKGKRITNETANNATRKSEERRKKKKAKI